MHFRILSLAILLTLGAGLRAPAQTSPRSLAHGRVQRYDVSSRQYARTRRFWIYTPPGYSASKSYDLLVAFDGEDYQKDIPLPAILDSLLAAGKIPPFVALLVDDSTGGVRTSELGNSPRFAAYLGDELVPWVRQQYSVTRDPHRTIVTGSSAGGLGAAYVAFTRPDLFGNVLSQSGAFWRGNDGSNGAPYEWLTSQIAATSRKDVRFVLDVGALETHATLGGSGPVFIEANRRLRDALKAKGYAVTYTEVPNGVHDAQSWRPRLPVGLVQIAGGWR